MVEEAEGKSEGEEEEEGEGSEEGEEEEEEEGEEEEEEEDSEEEGSAIVQRTFKTSNRNPKSQTTFLFWLCLCDVFRISSWRIWGGEGKGREREKGNEERRKEKKKKGGGGGGRKGKKENGGEREKEPLRWQ